MGLRMFRGLKILVHGVKSHGIKKNGFWGNQVVLVIIVGFREQFMG